MGFPRDKGQGLCLKGRSEADPTKWSGVNSVPPLPEYQSWAGQGSAAQGTDTCGEKWQNFSLLTPSILISNPPRIPHLHASTPLTRHVLPPLLLHFFAGSAAHVTNGRLRIPLPPVLLTDKLHTIPAPMHTVLTALSGFTSGERWLLPCRVESSNKGREKSQLL